MIFFVYRGLYKDKNLTIKSLISSLKCSRQLGHRVLHKAERQLCRKIRIVVFVWLFSNRYCEILLYNRTVFVLDFYADVIIGCLCRLDRNVCIVVEVLFGSPFCLCFLFVEYSVCINHLHHLLQSRLQPLYCLFGLLLPIRQKYLSVLHWPVL